VPSRALLAWKKRAFCLTRIFLVVATAWSFPLVQVRRAGSGGDTSSVRRTNFEQTQAFHWLVRLVRSRGGLVWLQGSTSWAKPGPLDGRRSYTLWTLHMVNCSLMKQAVYGPQVRRAGSGGDTSSVRRTNFEQTQALKRAFCLTRIFLVVATAWSFPLVSSLLTSLHSPFTSSQASWKWR
jgi:hypothetical protein